MATLEPITCLLIANRGEVAARIQATAQRLGIHTICVYATDDTSQAHLGTANAAYPLSGNGATAYLNQDELITIAHHAGADAIHPGYGFLSEVAGFAAAVERTGLLFIGPDSTTIKQLGNKGYARSLAQQCDIPVVPGATFAHTDAQKAAGYIQHIGYPVLLKSAGGGGGRGMAVVANNEELTVLWKRISDEGIRAFHSNQIVVEKYITNPRHIEVQIAGDGTQVIHLFERDCSTQRRRQKIIEEAPAPNLCDELRKKLHAAAVTLGKAAYYTNIGTVEFIVAPGGQYYFLEVNTRLQVEHGVTELITGVDLVALQLHIAQHHTLPFTQNQISVRGHALQCRIYAEDPAADFTPSTGTIQAHHIPHHPFTQVYHSLELPHTVNGLYDPILSKLLSFSRTRADTIQIMRGLLREYRIGGITTNSRFLEHILAHPLFVNGSIHTQSITNVLTSFMPTQLDLTSLSATISSALQHNLPPTPSPQRRSRWKEDAWR